LKAWKVLLVSQELNESSPVVGRAVLKKDEKTKSLYWLTTDSDWLDRISMDPNEPLILQTRAFEIGTSIEIRGKLSKSVIDENQ
jgi:hypothetical protein